MGFSRQENWGGLPFPSPEDLPDSRIELCLLCLLHCRRILYLLSHQSICKILLPDWLINCPEKAPSCPKPSWYTMRRLRVYPLPHWDRQRCFHDDTKNNLLFLVKSTNGFFFLFSFLFILFLLVGMSSVWAFPGCSVVKTLSTVKQ